MNDEASTDDELLQYFTKTLGLLEHDAAKLIARRTEFLNHLPKGVKP